MPSRSLSRRQLSRTKLELFRECPRCFHEDVIKGNRRPSMPPFTLNNAVDALLKREFDQYRAVQAPHPLFATVGLNAVPLQDARMGEWRANFTGVRWTDTETGWTLFGAVDDLWLSSSGEVMVADYKATAKVRALTAETLYPSYRRQAEIYQFLVERQGFAVSTRAWFVYANGISCAGNFANVLNFNTALIPYEGRWDWVLHTFRAAVALVEDGSVPPAGESCEHCKFAGRWIPACA